ncbi:SoxR reducing system RseC family protein [Rheinheimera maricola]|uniref:SoxR reducing system RseC family protein n=1 Tax=Rheinheimera maricola TaxID=2793282 RepID=A0ABS7X5W6_9GAMM|nr:SoxR reducing system RseC family protein [Rheinheimera maricola]MBZ9610022.1 SoxR reducing system RseC family protein [Rheinheimera maricola]
MVEEIATVVRAADNGLWLTTTPVASCNACQVSDDCGTGIVAKTITPRTQHFYIATELQLLPGEQVKIGLHEASLVKAALMVYLLPLLSLILFTMVGSGLALAEGWIILLALLGAGIGFMLARQYDRSQAGAVQLRILQVLPSLAVSQQSLASRRAIPSWGSSE